MSKRWLSLSGGIVLLFIILQASPASGQKRKTKSAPVPARTVSIDSKLYQGLSWRCIGPWRSGRCLAVAGVPGDPLRYYAGQTGGGIWMTTDGGHSWTCISDSSFHSSSVGAIAVAASNVNVIYAGMGEVEMRGNISFGDGIYKSVDAGKTWSHMGLEDSYAIGTIAVDPQNSDLVYAAAMGQIWGPTPNQQRGLFRSRDGGRHWDRILFIDDTTGCADVRMDPVNPRILYASMWKAWRTPYSLSSGGKGSGLYKSTDGGDTWKLISENPGMPLGPKGKIIVTVSPANHDRLWASVENEQYGIYFSEDGGASWNRVSTLNDLTQRPWYFSQLFADPGNSNTLYVLNVEFWKSIDAGHSWNRVTNNHGDNHDMWINPQNPDNWIMGDDGGPQITFNGGKSFTEMRLPTAQFYHVNLDNDFPYHVYGAQQDNTSVRISSRTAGSSITDRDWFPVAGGEAGYIVPDPTNPDITYGGEYDGIMSTFNKKNDQYRYISVYPEQHYGTGAETHKYRFNWTFPISFSPHNPHCLYATSQVVHRSFDAGQTWEVISPDLTRHDPRTLKASGGPITLDNTGTETYATIFAFAESPIRAGLLWAGSDDGLVHVSRDDGKTWTNVTPAQLPEWALISYVEPSHFDSATCYLSATRYKSGDTRPYIFKTTDFGKTWKIITGGLNANVYNRCIREDPFRKGMLYAGMETGIEVSFDDGDSWQSLNLNLPNTPVHDIQVQPGEHDLVIATHGRSFWILDDITPLYQLSDQVARSEAWLFKPRDSYRMPGPAFIEKNESRTDGENAPAGVMVRYYLKEAPKAELRLQFLTEKGDSIISFSSWKDSKGILARPSRAFHPDQKKTRPDQLKAEPGLQTFVWDMRYPPAKGDTSATFEASLAGPKIVPGTYRVRLLIGDSVIMEQPFLVKADPRNPATLEELKAQFDLNEKICEKLNAIARGTARIRKIRDEITSFTSSVSDSAAARSLRAIGQPLIDSLTAIEETLFNPRIQANEDNLRFPLRLEEKIATMNYYLQNEDTQPTASMWEVYHDLASKIDATLKKLNELIDQQLPAFNKLAAAHRGPVIRADVPE